MPPKKGKGKKKGALAKIAKAEELRLAQLYALETEAEELQQRENDRRAREEQDERVSLLREEQLRQIRAKEHRIEELSGKLADVTNLLKDDRLSYESQIEQLSILRDSLLNEVSLLKAENDESHRVYRIGRENDADQIQRCRTELEQKKILFESEKSYLREELQATQSAVEEYRTRVEEMEQTFETNEREHLSKVRALERELEKALIINKALQEAVELRESDDKKNVTLMQLLNAQIAESKRHFEEQLEDERHRTNRAKEEVLHLETKCAHLTEELDVLRGESSDARHATDMEMREYQRQFEQVKYDSEYLNSEIVTLRIQFTEKVEEAQAARTAAEDNATKYLVEMEALDKKVQEMECLLHRHKKEHFDQVTFLNAQICNNRTVITQLQQRLKDERAEHDREIELRMMEARDTIDNLKTLSDSEEKQRAERKIHDDKLLCELDQLRQSVTALRKDSQQHEREMEIQREAKDAEIKRLHNILDAHFIPHRQDVELGLQTKEQSLAMVLKDKLDEQTRKMVLTEQGAMESELWLKSRLANQADMIEALQHDLRHAQLRHCEEVQYLEAEVSRLRKTLDVHFISYTM